MDNEREEKQKPELVFADLHKGRRFSPIAYPITLGLVENFMDTVGDRHPLYSGDSGIHKDPIVPLAPPGLAAIYARLSYLQDYTMPSGGILIKQEFKFTGPIRIVDTLDVTAKVIERFTDDKERNWVTFFIEARNQKVEPISTIRLTVIWPK